MAWKTKILNLKLVDNLVLGKAKNNLSSVLAYFSKQKSLKIYAKIP